MELFGSLVHTGTGIWEALTEFNMGSIVLWKTSVGIDHELEILYRNTTYVFA